MEQINKTTVEQLLAEETTPAVTIYMPTLTTASPPQISENQIRLKNLVRKAGEMLEDRPDGKKIAQDLQTLAQELHDDMNFWEAQTPGLLICASPTGIKLFHLPIDTEEYVAVDDMYHLAPVIALANDQHEFYVVTVDQHSPALFKGNMYGLKRMNVEFPKDAAEALNIDEPNQKSENQGSATGSSLNSGWFNGRGGARNPQEQDRIRYFRVIDNIVNDTIDRSAPLILAGVESDIAEFRMNTKHPNVLEGFIAGNQKDTNLDDLFSQAYNIAWQSLVIPEHEAVIEEYQELHGANPSRVAQDKKGVLAAAEQGRIDKLLACMSRQTTDTVQDRLAAVQRITFPDPAQSKTLNQLAKMVYQMSGKVYNLLPNEMPDGAPMVARLRY